MALVNPNIAMSFRAPDIQPQNMLADYAALQQIQGGRQAQELNALKMQEARATMEERNALRQLNPSAADYESQLFKVSPQLGIQYRKEAATTAAQKAAQSTSEFDLKAKQRSFMDKVKLDLSSNPSDDNVRAFGQDAVIQGIYSKEVADREVAQLLAMPPEKRAQLLSQSGATVSERAPKVLVGPSGAFSVSPFGGPATPVAGAEAAFQMTPAQIEQSKRDQQRLGLEGQRVGFERERVGIARTEAERKMQGLEALPPKEIQKREAVLPQATAAVKGFETKATSFVNDLMRLRDHPGLSQITGIAAGRMPGLTADGRAAQALYDKVVAKGGFQALQDMRDASKTGGALGNVSNQEGKQLTASFAAIDRRQDAPDVKSAIDTAISDIEGSKVRMREAYDSTYAYKTGGAPAATTAPLVGANVVVTPDGQSHTFPNAAAAAQFKKAAGL